MCNSNRELAVPLKYRTNISLIENFRGVMRTGDRRRSHVRPNRDISRTRINIFTTLSEVREQEVVVWIIIYG